MPGGLSARGPGCLDIERRRQLRRCAAPGGRPGRPSGVDAPLRPRRRRFRSPARGAMMDLILWLHAEAQEAGDGSDDLARALTAKGEKQAARMAAWLAPPLPPGPPVPAPPPPPPPNNTTP